MKRRSRAWGPFLIWGGVGFRVWAPNAQRVSVIGSFNDWDGGKHPMKAEENGHWYTDVAEAHLRAGTPRSARRWLRPWCSPRQAFPCSSRARNSSREIISATRSPSIGTNATSSTASFGCTATLSGCGSIATASPWPLRAVHPSLSLA